MKGEDAPLNALVERWDGHALTLSLVGSYLVERFGVHALARSHPGIRPPKRPKCRYASQ